MNTTPGLDHTLLLQWLFGAFVVGLYARDRFDSPHSTRCTTTFTRYWIARVGYIGSMLLLFLVLGGAVTDLDLKPLWQLMNLPSVDKDAQSLPGPLLAALVLTSLLPHFPYLSKIDDAVKLWFQRVGNIPFEVRELSGQMRNAAFQPGAGVIERLRPTLEEMGIDEHLLEAPPGSFRRRWAQAAVLLASVQSWAGSRGYVRYVDEQKERMAELDNRFDSLRSLLDHRTLAELDRSGDSSLADPFRRKLRRDIDEFHQAVCDFASGGVLHAEWGPRGRYAALELLGFMGLARPRHALGSHEMVLVGGLIFFGTLLVSLLTRRFFDPTPMQAGMRLTVMVTLIYVIAIVLAIYPKAVWPFADIRAVGRRPAAAYAASGLASAGAALLVSLLFRFVLDEKGNLLQMLATPGRFTHAWTVTLERWPWLLMTACATVAIAWAADDHVLAGTPAPRWLRYAEAAGLALVFALLQWMVVELMTSGVAQAVRDEWMRRLPRMVLTSMVIGLSIGYLVPHLYRNKSAPQPATPQPVAAVAVQPGT